MIMVSVRLDHFYERNGYQPRVEDILHDPYTMEDYEWAKNFRASIGDSGPCHPVASSVPSRQRDRPHPPAPAVNSGRSDHHPSQPPHHVTSGPPRQQGRCRLPRHHPPAPAVRSLRPDYYRPYQYHRSPRSLTSADRYTSNSPAGATASSTLRRIVSRSRVHSQFQENCLHWTRWDRIGGQECERCRG